VCVYTYIHEIIFHVFLFIHTFLYYIYIYIYNFNVFLFIHTFLYLLGFLLFIFVEDIRVGFIHSCLLLRPMHVCMYACVHVCMYVCMHVCIHALYLFMPTPAAHADPFVIRMHGCMHVCMYAYCVYFYHIYCDFYSVFWVIPCMHVCIYVPVCMDTYSVIF
jgi:hypothetical protein